MPFSGRRSYFQDDDELSTLLRRLITSDCIVVDGGARGGTHELARIAPHITTYGFEPNAAEFEKLDTEPAPPYHRRVYSPLALLERTGQAKLYITRRPSASSTLLPSRSLLAHFGRDCWSQMGEVVREEVVNGVSMRDFMRNERLRYVDYVKLDTQGNELQILRSSGEFLRTFGVVKTEVEMLPLYEGQALFGDVFSFLTSAGFQLVDLAWTPPCRRYHWSPNLPAASYRLVWGDAIFAYDPFHVSADRKLEQAVILAELGYVDLALYLISRIPKLAVKDREQLLAFYARPKPPTGRSKSIRVAKRILKRYLPTRLFEAYRIFRESGVPKAVRPM